MPEFPVRTFFRAGGGIDLLQRVKNKRFDIPCLLYSAESLNAEKARAIDVAFVDKNAPSLFAEVGLFFKDRLGFDDFIFKNTHGHEIARASTLRALETQLNDIPEEVFRRHCQQNDFSRWLFVRSEIELASKVRNIRCDDFSCESEHRQSLIAMLKESRMQRQEGVIVNLTLDSFDTDTRFLKIGNGSLGGKARGLAFMAAQIPKYRSQLDQFKNARIAIPQTLVITTDIFDEFIEHNNLRQLAREKQSDAAIAEHFMHAAFPEETAELLRTYLSVIRYPLAVRSSSLHEDARSWAYAGLYRTVMLPNDHPELECRLNDLIRAIKLVYASTFFKGPKTFSRSVGQLVEEEKMAVIVQQLMGVRQGRFFYPAISGMAQSHNFYPYSNMRTQDGIAAIALGLGKTVMDGERALRFSPVHPGKMAQSSAVKDTLDNAQRYFYALELENKACALDIADGANLIKRDVADAEKEPPVRELLSTYFPEEDRIRDSFDAAGYRVLTFASVLKYGRFPLADMLNIFLKMGQAALRCQVEIEFCVDQLGLRETLPAFSILQIRPMSNREQAKEITISDGDIKKAVCVSAQALGNTIDSSMTDIVYVDADVFDPSKTVEIAAEIRKINAGLLKEGRKYLLIGPGRWGSADRWLGIPVKWADICGVGGIIETAHDKLHAEPSQGSHFFHNLVSLGIAYLTVFEKERERLDVKWLAAQTKVVQERYIVHSRLDRPFTLKVSGQESFGVLLSPGG